jgi:FkbM family methyltransferase
LPNESLQLHQSRLNRLAKQLAKPLSRIATWGPLLRASRYADAYVNILMGNGSGTGWDLQGEVDAAVAVLTTAQPTILDIGANTGEWTRLLLRRLPDARVFLFEPAAGCHEHLRPLLGARVTLVPNAVGMEEGSAKLWSSSATDGAASLHPRHDTYFEGKSFRSFEVRVTTIDTFLRESEIGTVDFMKIDIEGHELAALQGAKQAFNDGRIRALAFEFGSANINSRTYFRDFWDLLTHYGFHLSRVTPGGYSLPIRSYSEDLEYFRGVTNYVAINGASERKQT